MLVHKISGQRSRGNCPTAVRFRTATVSAVTILCGWV